MSERIKDIFLSPLPIEIQFENIGVSECLPGHQVGPEVRHEYILHFVQSGKGYFFFDDAEYDMTKGNFFILTPGTTVSYKADEASPWVYKWISFSGAHLSELFEIININLEFPIGKVTKYQAIDDYFDYLLQSPDFLQNNSLAIYSSLFKLLSLFEVHDTPKKQNRMLSEDTFDHLVNRFYNLLDTPQNLALINVEKAAKELGVSRSYLNRLVKGKTEQSASQWIMAKKIQRGCFLLESSKMNIMEVASELGYDHSSSFSRAFTSVTGLSPSQYRTTYFESLKQDGYYSKKKNISKGRQTIIK